MKTLTKKPNRIKRRRPAPSAQPSVAGSLFGRVERVFRIDTSFERGLPTRFVPYILYFTIIGMFYIGNNHYAERMIRRMDQLEREVEDLRANYTTLKASYMYESKQSQVAQARAETGLRRKCNPPV